MQNNCTPIIENENLLKCPFGISDISDISAN